MDSNSNFSFFQWAREEQQRSRKSNTCLRGGAKWAKMCPKSKCPFLINIFFFKVQVLVKSVFFFRNAVGLSIPKHTGQNFIIDLKIMICFAFAVAHASTECPPLYSIKIYALHMVPWSRQVASGITVTFKKNFISNFKVLNKMSHNLLETAKFRLWKRQNQIKVTLFITLPIMSLWLKFWTIRLAIIQSF